MNSKDKMLYYTGAYNEALQEWRAAIILQMHTINPIKHRTLSKKINRLDKRIELYLLLEEKYWNEWRSCFR